MSAAEDELDSESEESSDKGLGIAELFADDDRLGVSDSG